MAVTKINGFQASYRSQTFQGQAQRVAGTSGLMRLDGSITTGGGNITVPPFTFIQNGLIVVVDTPRVVTDPDKPAPYYLAVSAATTAPTDDLSFQTPEAPSDISSAQVLIGYWDGVEWRKPQLLSLSEVYVDMNQANIDFGRQGPVSGLLTTYTSPNYSTAAGVVVDRQGLRQKLTLPAVFPGAAVDGDFSRVDRIVYRRPDDSANRIGMRQYVLGGAHAAAFSMLYNTEFIGNAYVHSSPKTLVGSDNAAHFLVARGYGGVFNPVYTKYSSSRTSLLVAPTQLAITMDSSKFDACIDKNNALHIVFTQGGDLYWAKISSSGAIVVTPKRVHDPAGAYVTNPSCTYDSELDRVFIASEVVYTLSDHRLFFQSLANNNAGIAFAKTPTQMTIVSGKLANPSIAISLDKDVYIAVEEQITHRIFLGKYDDVGAQIGASIAVSAGGSKLPRVLLADNKEVFVTHLQDKGSTYGISVWRDGFSSLVDLFSPTEDFTDYSAVIDNVLNGLHFLTVGEGLVRYAKREGSSVPMSGTVASVAATGISLARDRYGALLHSWSEPFATAYTDYDVTSPIPYGGNQTVTIGPDSVYLAAEQMLVLKAEVPALRVGDRVTTSGLATPNNLTAYVTGLDDVSLDGTVYWHVTLSLPFAADWKDIPAQGTATFAALNGNAVRFAKSNSELTSLAYRFDVLDTDILLARVSLPGPIILNYTDSGIGPVPAPTSRLIPFGHGVTFDWGYTTLGAMKITGGLHVLDLVNNYDYALADGEYPVADGEALYVKLDLSTPTPVPQVASVAVLDWSEPIQVLGYAVAGNFIPHALLTSLDLEEMEPGEVVSVGHDLPDMIRQRLGIVSDTQYEAYTSHNNFLPEDSYPASLSKLDLAVYDIQTDFNDEEVAIIGAPTSLYTATGMLWEGAYSSHDILVFINGKKQTQSKTGGLDKDYYKFDTNKLQFSYTIPAGQEIAIFKVRKGGGNPGFLVGKNQGTQIIPVCQKINFTGSGVTAANGGSGQMNVFIPGGPAQALRFVKSYRSGEAGTIPAGSTVAFDGTGNIVLADANVTTLSDFVGITLTDITPGNYGEVVKVGDVPGVLLGLGALPGDLVYLGEVPGSLSLAPPTGLSDTIIIMGRAEPETAAFPDGTATALYLQPQITSVGV